VPWLMLDRGLDLNGDGSNPWAARDDGDLLPVASNIEDLQVAYVMNRNAGGGATDSNANFVLGDDPAIATPEEPDPTAQAPGYSTVSNATTRQTLHPANIQAVRISMVIRSAQADKARPGQPGDPLPLLENSTRVLTATEVASFRRFRISAVVPIRNLMSRGMFVF
jgi:type IV pilus assembly protein PilW